MHRRRRVQRHRERLLVLPPLSRVRPRGSRERRADAARGLLVFLLCFCVFRIAPIRQSTDSHYSMLLAENVLRHGDLALERYRLPEPDYRLRRIGEHLYYSFPPGSSLLSVPLVALLDWTGTSALGPDGGYDGSGEQDVAAALA